MAKQTFTTGQVLTAAQMTSLQETAMGGGPATAKTANYVLVAADAGTTVAMDAATATTITVDTGLFAAGDTVFIQNLGAGDCTITAGTATVATAGSLILPQNDAGILYFTSASAAIFYDYIQVGATSPLTTKGDLYTFGTSDTRLPVGTDGFTLVADSVETTGLKWVAPAAGATSYALLNVGGTALTGAATITVSGLSGYNKFLVLISGASTNTTSSQINVRINGASTDYSDQFAFAQYQTTYSSGMASASSNSDKITIASMSSSASSVVRGHVIIDGGNSSGVKIYSHSAGAFAPSGTGQTIVNGGGTYTDANVISSISILSSTGDFDAGTIFVYGAN
jgi:hypothetical protein